eukprot:2285649-Rhodomonas_salina.2
MWPGGSSGRPPLLPLLVPSGESLARIRTHSAGRSEPTLELEHQPRHASVPASTHATQALAENRGVLCSRMLEFCER